jgi:putative modified peptide
MASLSPDVVDKLLDKLGSDDHFRAHFQQNPHAALTSIGAPTDVNIEGCMKPSKLAPKEQIQGTRAVFRDALLGKGDQKVFCLEAK